MTGGKKPTEILEEEHKDVNWQHWKRLLAIWIRERNYRLK